MTSLRSPRRQREDGRQLILSAARRLFTAIGYDGVGIREIAASAGVDKMMINRWFGSKEALFEEAVARQFDVGPYLAGDRATFGERIVRGVLADHTGPDGFNPVAATLRSLGNDRAVAILSSGIDDRIVDPLAAWLEGAEAHERALAIVSQLVGATTMLNTLGSRHLHSSDREALIAKLAWGVQTLVDGL